jgi:hypothetical protein
MDHRSRIAFLALVLAQAAHSVEEYVSGLYDVFPVARFASSLVSSDLATGFAVLNFTFVAFGLWCYFVPVRLAWASARAWVWPWVFVELGNGIGHPLLVARSGGYFPGVATAPILLVLASYLAMRLLRGASAHEGSHPTRRCG